MRVLTAAVIGSMMILTACNEGGDGTDHCFMNEFCKQVLEQSCEFMNERG